MKGFKKCSNGHWYKEELAQCPYCQASTSGDNKTRTFDDLGAEETRPFTENGNGRKTEMVDFGKNRATTNSGFTNSSKADTSNRTVFGGTEFEEETESGEIKVTKEETRKMPRLVGWLVTYSLDPSGNDYKVYEGRNVIGRDIECNITVNDKLMSAKHATILFRGNKYIIKDELSTHGTFVNGEDSGVEPVELHDSDVVKMGETLFKFKSSL
jgi:hypothetical protein